MKTVERRIKHLEEKTASINELGLAERLRLAIERAKKSGPSPEMSMEEIKVLRAKVLGRHRG